MSWLALHSSWIFSTIVAFGCLFSLFLSSPSCTNRPKRFGYFSVGASVLLLGWFSFHNLGSYAGTLLTWECEVTSGFLSSLHDNLSIGEYLSNVANWQDGTVARGDQSFYYGLPTYAVLKYLGLSLFNLRFFAAIAAVLAVFLIFKISTKTYGPQVGICTALLYAANPAVYYYSKYGTSLSASILGVLICFAAIVYWQGWRSRSVLMPYTFFLLSFLATLNYSPARIVILIMFLLTLMHLIWSIFGRPSNKGRLIHAVLAILVCSALTAYVETRSGGTTRFLSARGEQAFNLVNNPDYVTSELGNPELASNSNAKFLFFTRTIERRAWELLNQLVPLSSSGEVATNARALGDPPRLKLYQSGFFPFILLGIFLAFLNVRRFENQLCLAWLFIGSLPLLLTNRVDLHRVFVFLPPLLIFGGLGLSTCLSWIGRRRALAFLPNLLLLLLTISAATYNFQTMAGNSQVPPAFTKIRKHVENSSMHSFLFGARGYCGDIYWLNFEMAEHKKRFSEFKFEILDPAISDSLANARVAANPEASSSVLPKFAAFQQTILYPSGDFREFIQALPSQAFRIENQGDFLIIERAR